MFKYGSFLYICDWLVWLAKKTGVVAVESTNSWDFPYCCLNDIRRGRGMQRGDGAAWPSRQRWKATPEKGNQELWEVCFFFPLFPVFEDKTKKV